MKNWGKKLFRFLQIFSDNKKIFAHSNEDFLHFTNFGGLRVKPTMT